MTDEQITQMCADVAREAWKVMNQAYTDYCEANADSDTDNALDDCEINLYVYANGNWVIEHAQYLTDHRDIVAVVPIAHYNGPAELAETLDQEFDDSFIQPGDDE